MYTVLYVSIKLRNQIIRDLYVNQTFYFPILVSISTLHDAFVMEVFIQELLLGFVPKNFNGSRFVCGSTHWRITLAGSHICASKYMI